MKLEQTPPRPYELDARLELHVARRRLRKRAMHRFDRGDHAPVTLPASKLFEYGALPLFSERIFVTAHLGSPSIAPKAQR